jgi:hypothetical protein
MRRSRPPAGPISPVLGDGATSARVIGFSLVLAIVAGLAFAARSCRASDWFIAFAHTTFSSAVSGPSGPGFRSGEVDFSDVARLNDFAILSANAIFKCPFKKVGCSAGRAKKKDTQPRFGVNTPYA